MKYIYQTVTVDTRYKKYSETHLKLIKPFIVYLFLLNGSYCVVKHYSYDVLSQLLRRDHFLKELNYIIIILHHKGILITLKNPDY